MPRTSKAAAEKAATKPTAVLDDSSTTMPAEKANVKSGVTGAKFSKVSFEQFAMDSAVCGIVAQEDFLRSIYDNIKLPARATKDSAGYDIFTPFPFDLLNLTADPRGFTFPTGIHCEMPQGMFLMIVPKSGLGFKHYSRLGNTLGIIDADYWHSDNEGDIMVNIRSDIPGNPPVHIEAGRAVCQGILVPYAVTDDDNADGIRNGGFGSTGK